MSVSVAQTQEEYWRLGLEPRVHNESAYWTLLEEVEAAVADDNYRRRRYCPSSSILLQLCAYRQAAFSYENCCLRESPNLFISFLSLIPT